LSAKDNIFSLKYTINLKGNLTHLGNPVVMGILNVTPDSFYDGGRYVLKSDIQRQAEKMLSEGAFVLDIGGYSSRPGAHEVDVKEELKRVTDGIKFVLEKFPGAHISVDTFRAEVAEAALNEGACMVNDISGGELDPGIVDVVAKWNVPFVVMHMRGTPKDMAQMTNYDNLLLEIIDYFHRKINLLRHHGVNDVIIDPGFGFAKKADQSFSLLRNLKYLKVLECPLMIGVSRKSMIYRTLGVDSEGALNGTTILNIIGLINGASMLRVHDVKEAVECIKLYKKVFS
jgi:dihydropteroate synthase